MTTKRRPLFDGIRTGLEDWIAHARGDLTLRTVAVPEEPPEIDSQTLAALRDRAAMSQAVFAKMLNVSTKTLQSWEQGVRQPSDASRRLIQVFSSHLEILCRTAGLPEIQWDPRVDVEPLLAGYFFRTNSTSARPFRRAGGAGDRGR